MLTSRPYRIVAVFVLLMGGADLARAGKKIHVGEKSSRNVSMDQIEHVAWNALLERFVDRHGQVDYRGWKASPGDMRRLENYLLQLSQADARKPAAKEAKLAYWINAYNAVTIWGMLREYPTTSIRKHTAKIYGYNIWHDLLLHVGDSTVSLDQMEHAILRKMGDPRIHFAVVCASKGCPRLLNEAYTSERLEEQLDRNARDFFSRPQNFRYEPSKNRFYLSAILSWYGTDFGRRQADQLNKIAPWLPTSAARKAAQAGTARVSYLKYDWSINEQSASRKRVAHR